MLASPVSPSVSLGTRSSSSSSHAEGNTHSYASPRHPAYLPSGTTSNPQNNQALSPSHSISSKSSAATNTSNYSKYTTLSQIGRVNDVLVEKVLLHQPVPREQENEKGTALKRLIAFLDGDGVETRPANIAQQQQIQASTHEQDDRLNKQYGQYARPHQAREIQHAQDTDPSIYPSHDPSLHPSTPPHIPRQYTHNPIPQDNHNMHNQTHTSRPGSSQSRFHPPQPPHVEHHAPYANNEQGQRRVYNASQYFYPNQGEAGPSRAAGSSGPYRDVVSSTQAQLDRLKSEVTQLDELVNRLKAHHITTESASSNNDIPFSAEQPSDAQHREHLTAEEEERLAENQRKAQQEAEAEHRRKILEYEASPATQTDLLRLIREMDSLVWMRRPSSSKSTSEGMDAQNSRLGYGPRSDDVIFTKGNLDHLARRMRAWENVVRHKEREDDERYNIVS